MIAPQAYAGYATEIAREAADEIFVEPAPVAAAPSVEPAPDPSFLVDRRRPSPSPSPSAVPTGDADHRARSSASIPGSAGTPT